MMGDGYFGVTGAAGIVFTTGGSNSVISNPGLPQAGSSSGSLPDSETGLKHDTGLAVEWSVNEQCKLEEGLVMLVAFLLHIYGNLSFLFYSLFDITYV